MMGYASGISFFRPCTAPKGLIQNSHENCHFNAPPRSASLCCIFHQQFVVRHRPAALQAAHGFFFAHVHHICIHLLFHRPNALTKGSSNISPNISSIGCFSQSLVKPPRNMDWTFPSGMSMFGASPRTQHPNHGRNLVYDTIGILHNFSQHYLKKVLVWQPEGHRRAGHPKHCWDNLLANFCVERPHFFGSRCCGHRLLEFDVAAISCIQFAQHYVICIYGMRIAFVLLTPVLQRGCPMGHTRLTVDHWLF